LFIFILIQNQIGTNIFKNKLDFAILFL